MRAIELRDITVRYDHRPVVENITVDVNEGTFLGLIGPNGGGKTTVLKVILGLIRPQRGEVLVYGKPPEHARRHGLVGYVPQHPLADLGFPVSVFDVAMMGRYSKIGLLHRAGKRDRERVNEMLERVKMADLRDRPIGELSGGQQQRVLIARALAAEPRILLMDEPLTGIDAGTQEAFYSLLKDLRKTLNLTVVMASHDIGVIPHHVGEIACINRQMHVHGRPTEVLTVEGLKKVYGCEVELLVHGRIPHRVVEEHHD
jgi:zinc transport system ATP-binding protein